MPLQKLADELEETARQNAEMVEGIAAGVSALADAALTPEAARTQALAHIVKALQMQDRLDQRHHNLAGVARALAQLDDPNDRQACARIWSQIELDELRDPRCQTAHQSGEVDLF